MRDNQNMDENKKSATPNNSNSDKKEDVRLEDLPSLNPDHLAEGDYIICPSCGDKMPKTIHTCVNCGQRLRHSTYTPISPKKAAFIRTIVGVVLLIVFFILWFTVLAK